MNSRAYIFQNCPHRARAEAYLNFDSRQISFSRRSMQPEIMWHGTGNPRTSNATGFGCCGTVFTTYINHWLLNLRRLDFHTFLLAYLPSSPLILWERNSYLSCLSLLVVPLCTDSGSRLTAPARNFRHFKTFYNEAWWRSCLPVSCCALGLVLVGLRAASHLNI